MNRRMAITILNVMAERYAQKYNLDIKSTESSSCGIWDSTKFTRASRPFIEIFEDKYGKMQDLHYTNVPYEEYDLRKDFKVSIEYRFSNPKICIGTQWGEDGYATLELNDPNKDDEYKVSEVLAFKESGYKYLKMLMRDFRATCKEFGVDTKEDGAD